MKSKIHKEKIQPLMKTIKELCKEAGIPFFAKFQLGAHYFNIYSDEGFDNEDELKDLHKKWGLHGLVENKTDQ